MIVISFSETGTHRIHVRKWLFSISLILFMPVFQSLSAQNSFADRLTIGFAGGGQITNISNPGYATLPESKIEPIFGIFGIYNGGWLLQLKAGIYFDPRGYRTKYKSDYIIENDSTDFVGYNSYFEYNINYSITYLTIPISLVYEKSSKKFKVFLEGGIYYSLYLKNHVKGFTDVYVHPDDAPHFSDTTLTAGHHPLYHDQNLVNFFNTYDFGIDISLGLGYQVTKQLTLQFTPEFSYGFANVFENPDYFSRWNNLFKIHVGILYKLHPKNIKQQKP